MSTTRPPATSSRSAVAPVAPAARAARGDRGARIPAVDLPGYRAGVLARLAAGAFDPPTTGAPTTDAPEETA